MKPAGKYVLDSFALLSYLQDERGAELVREVLEYGRRHTGCVGMSVINLGECLYIIEREQGLAAAHLALAAIEQLPIDMADTNRSRALAAAHLKAHHRLSYADAFAIALALESASTVVTGDPGFKEVEKLLPVLWLPR